MIRPALKEDIPAMSALWKECFADDDSLIAAFFSSEAYKFTVPLVYCDSGEIVSQLFLIDGELRHGGESFSSYYLYAACTSPRFRGKGIMGELIIKARSLASEKGKSFIFLLPGEAGLYDYYSKFGFRAVCAGEKRRIEKGGGETIDISRPLFYSEPCRILAKDFASVSGGQYVCETHNDFGCACYEKKGDMLEIGDIDINAKTREFIDLLLEKNGCSYASVLLPCARGTIPEPRGMVLPLTPDSLSGEPAFLNFTLE